MSASSSIPFAGAKSQKVPWQPGYWETATETGEEFPPPERLEHDHVIRDRCSLWMRLHVWLQNLGRPEVGIRDRWNQGNMSVDDGWAYGRDSWLCYMVLMEDVYAHPPAREPVWLEGISADQRRAFKSILSDCQKLSWDLLLDWWQGNYQDAELSSCVRTFIMAAPHANINSIQPQTSLYQEVLFCLWSAEFNPGGLRQGTSRGLDSNRRMAYEHALAQKAGALILRGLSPGTVPDGQRQHDRVLPKCCDICPWLVKDQKNMSRKNLPLYLWDTKTNRTVRVDALLKQAVPISYACISHTWGRFKKNPSSSVQVPGVDNWMVPENSLFDVRDLPKILGQAKSGTRFIWFDLVCLPQDTTSPEYLSEVSRQATIFHNASKCLAWINTVSSWTTLRASLRWLCLYYLHAGNNIDRYGVQRLLKKAGRIKGPIEFFTKRVTDEKKQLFGTSHRSLPAAGMGVHGSAPNPQPYSRLTGANIHLRVVC